MEVWKKKTTFKHKIKCLSFPVRRFARTVRYARVLYLGVHKLYFLKPVLAEKILILPRLNAGEKSDSTYTILVQFQSILTWKSTINW